MTLAILCANQSTSPSPSSEALFTGVPSPRGQAQFCVPINQVPVILAPHAVEPRSKEGRSQRAMSCSGWAAPEGPHLLPQLTQQWKRSGQQGHRLEKEAGSSRTKEDASPCQSAGHSLTRPQGPSPSSEKGRALPGAQDGPVGRTQHFHGCLDMVYRWLLPASYCNGVTFRIYLTSIASVSSSGKWV